MSSKDHCQIRCDQDSSCDAFDYSEKHNPRCRKFRNAEARYGDYNGRVHCLKPGFNPGACTTSGFVTVDCMCGKSRCDAGKYCMDGKCVEMNQCTGHGRVDVTCLCGESDSPCPKGNYYLSTGECAIRPPTCQAGLNFQSCTCADSIFPENNYCTAGECSPTAPALPGKKV